MAVVKFHAGQSRSSYRAPFSRWYHSSQKHNIQRKEENERKKKKKEKKKKFHENVKKEKEKESTTDPAATASRARDFQIVISLSFRPPFLCFILFFSLLSLLENVYIRAGNAREKRASVVVEKVLFHPNYFFAVAWARARARTRFSFALRRRPGFFFFLFFLSLYSFLRISVLLFGVLFFLRRSHSPYLVHLTTDIFSLPANGRVPNFSSPASSSSSLTVTSFTSIRKENGGRKKTRIRTGRSFASAIFVFVLRWSVYNQKKEGRRNNDSWHNKQRKRAKQMATAAALRLLFTLPFSLLIFLRRQRTEYAAKGNEGKKEKKKKSPVRTLCR